MGVAHALLNAAGLDLSVTSLVLRARGRRNAGRLAFLAGYSLAGLGAHLGGELSYGYGLRVNRDVFEGSGPDEFTPVLEESELPDSGMRSVEVGGTQILLSRVGDGRICAISNVCNHFRDHWPRGNAKVTPSSVPYISRASTYVPAKRLTARLSSPSHATRRGYVREP